MSELFKSTQIVNINSKTITTISNDNNNNIQGFVFVIKSIV
jgi:hypothetical protein